MRGAGGGTGAPGAAGFAAGTGGAGAAGRAGAGFGGAGDVAAAGSVGGLGATGALAAGGGFGGAGAAGFAVAGADGSACTGGFGGCAIGGRTGRAPCNGGRKTGALPPPVRIFGTAPELPFAGVDPDARFGAGRERSRVGSSNSGKVSGSPDALPRRRFRILSAVPSSRELEWVFFSLTPTSGRRSRISWALTSNSLASSLTRILCAPVKSAVAPHAWALILHHACSSESSGVCAGAGFRPISAPRHRPSRLDRVAGRAIFRLVV